MASFVQTDDPNTHKATNADIPGVPDIEEGRQFVIGSDGVRQGGLGRLEERCRFWLGVAGKVDI